MISVAAMGIDLLVSWATGRSLDSTLGGIESKIRNPRKALEKAVKKICDRYNIEESSLRQKSEAELRSFLDEEQWIELSLEFLDELSKSDKEKKLSHILMKNRVDLESVRSKIEEMDLESLKTMMKSSTAAFSFYEVPSEKDLRNELGAFELAYIEREEIQVETLKKEKRVVFVGKCGSGKSRLLFEVLQGKSNVVFIKSFFTVNDLIGLDMGLRPLNDFVVVWDNLHMFKEEEIKKCLQRISDLCKEKGIEFYFFGGSRKESMYYGLPIEEISLSDMREVQLVEACSEKYEKKINKKVSEMLLDAGDGTPEYIISFFRTFKKEEITEEDLKDPPSDVVDVWRRYIRDMGIKGTDMEKVLRSVALCSRGFERVILGYVEDLYVHVFHGELSHFEDSLRSLEEMFFIEEVNEEEYSFHDSRAEAVEEIFPLKTRNVDRLVAVISKLPQEVRRFVFGNYADWSYFSERYEFCVKFYDCIIELDPGYVQAYNNRGLVYSDLNQYEKAIENYDKAIELREKLPDKGARVYYSLGEAMKKIKNFEEAANAFKTAGLTFHSLEEFEPALRCISKGFQLIEHIQNESVVYCGLFLYIISKDTTIKNTLQKIKIQNKTLEDIFTLAVKKDRGGTIENDIKTLSKPIRSPDLIILLSLLIQSAES